MSIITLADEIVHYEVLGRGRPVLFLHGWIGSWRYWVPAMQFASISYRTYALDMWGFGDTARRLGDYTIAGQSSLVASFLEALGMDKIALVGHGLGGLVGLYFSSQNPGMVDRLLVTGVPEDPASLHPRMRQASAGELAEWLLGRHPSAEAAKKEAAKTDAQAIQLSLNDLSMLDLSRLVNNLACPALFVYGEDDPAVPVPPNGALDSLPPFTHAIVFAASAHFPMLDEASQYNRLLIDFLALPSGESPRQLQLKEEWKRRVR